MTENTTTEVKATTEGAAAVPTAARPARPSFGARSGGANRGGARGGAAGGRGGAGGSRPGGARGGRGGGFERTKPEFDTKMIQIRRVTRVVAGGRRFSFSVAIVAGNGKGSVGVGIGKAADTATAIEKATKNAKKTMIKVRLDDKMMIPHAVEAKDASARVIIMPALGRGMVAGSAVRNVLELAGIKNVRAKILSGSKNKLNIARAAVKALGGLRSKKVRAEVAAA